MHGTINVAAIATLHEIPVDTFASLACIPADEVRAKLPGALTIKADVGARLIVEHFPQSKGTTGFAWASDIAGVRQNEATRAAVVVAQAAREQPAHFVPIGKSDEDILATLRAMNPDASEAKIQEALKSARRAHGREPLTPLPGINEITDAPELIKRVDNSFHDIALDAVKVRDLVVRKRNGEAGAMSSADIIAVLNVCDEIANRCRAGRVDVKALRSELVKPAKPSKHSATASGDGARFDACLPDGSLRFNTGFTATLDVAGAKSVRTFHGTAYGGGVITDHPMWDRVAFDLATTKFEKMPTPALYGHREPVGVIDSARIGASVEIEGKLFADIDPQARKVAEYADRGTAWQLSVGIWPGRQEQIGDGQRVTVNGQEMVGPLVVFRDSRIREVSFCPLGADGSTAVTIGG